MGCCVFVVLASNLAFKLINDRTFPRLQCAGSGGLPRLQSFKSGYGVDLISRVKAFVAVSGSVLAARPPSDGTIPAALLAAGPVFQRSADGIDENLLILLHGLGDTPSAPPDVSIVLAVNGFVYAA